jgi:CheY-like chemotaxis protein
VLLTDFNLGGSKGENGCDLLRRARAAFPETPQILVAGFAKDALDEAACGNMVINGFLSKPVSPEKLLETLNHVCRPQVAA